MLFVAAWPGFLAAELKDKVSNGYSPEETRRVLNRAVDLTFASLFERGVKIYVFETVPGAKKRVPYTLARAKYFHVPPPDIRFTTEEYKLKNKFFDEAFERNSRFITERFSPAKVLCSTGTCKIITSAGIPLYFDDNHTTSAALPTFVSILRDGYRPEPVVRNP